ncbi:MAG TPA: ABC transporter permease [Rhodospirillaceae bacterium]|nr:ABC transporter permease [Rhodospirillaceae bacterium]
MDGTSDAPDGLLTTGDGTPLKTALARATRRAKLKAVVLVLPLLLFVLVTFAVPIGQMLYLSVYSPVFADNMPRLSAYLMANPVTEVPGEAAFEALVLDLKDARKNRTHAQVGTRVNYEKAGSTSLFKSTARRLRKIDGPPYKEKLLALKPAWDDLHLWTVMERAAHRHTLSFYASALDLGYDAKGDLVRAPEERRIYGLLFQRTLLLSALIAGLCLLLGYPVAHLLANLPLKYSNLLMVLVLLPFWTSLLVRTTSWITLLQSQGVLNDLMVWIGIVGDDGRIQLMYNQAGTVIAMTHIMLPFMILPLYSVMKTVPKDFVRAARSLGAGPVTAFVRVYFPQTVPGIGAGVLLVFIISVGYYITPALVGGSSGQLISNQIAFHMLQSLNWGLAAALGALLLGGVLLLYWLYDRLVGVDNMKLG